MKKAATFFFKFRHISKITNLGKKCCLKIGFATFRKNQFFLSNDANFAKKICCEKTAATF